MIFMKKPSLVILLTALLAAPLPVFSDEFDLDQMVTSLEGSLDQSMARMEELEPELRAALKDKSNSISADIDKAMERGFVELESINKDLHAASDQVADKLQEALTSEEMEKLKSFLSQLDKDVISASLKSLVDQLAALLELTKDQINDLKPLLQENFERYMETLSKYMSSAEKDFEKFKIELEETGRETRKRLEALLDSEQLAKFRSEEEAINERIKSEIFAE